MEQTDLGQKHPHRARVRLIKHHHAHSRMGHSGDKGCSVIAVAASPPQAPPSHCALHPGARECLPFHTKSNTFSNSSAILSWSSGRKNKQNERLHVNPHVLGEASVSVIKSRLFLFLIILLKTWSTKAPCLSWGSMPNP